MKEDFCRSVEVSEESEFHKDCLSDSKVTCSDELLHDKWLVTKNLAGIWWDLTDKERYTIAGHIIQSYSLMNIQYERKGKFECMGGEGDWKKAVCMQNAIIRVIHLANGEEWYDSISNCYYKVRAPSPEHCYYEECFGLPVYIAAVYTEGTGFGHSICAIQVKNRTPNFDSWRFFQYTTDDIKPGSWQMPCGYESKDIMVRIDDLTSLYCNAYSSNKVAKWRIDSGCHIFI